MNSLFSTRRFFIFIFFLTILLRLPSLTNTFLDVDESQFAVAAQQLMDGGSLYRDTVDTKPPLIYLFYQSIFSLFGRNNMLTVHLTSIGLTFFICYLLFQMGRKIGGQRSGYFTALFYTVFSTCFLPKFIATSITSVMILPLTLAIYFVILNDNKKIGVHYFLAGLFTAFAFLFKYQGGIQLPILGLFLMYQFFKKEISFPRFLNQSFQLFIGFLTPLMMTGFWLYHAGVWDDFVEWSFRGSARYIQSGVETIPFWHNLITRGGGFVAATLLLWGLFFRRHSRESDNPVECRPVLIHLWFFLSLIPVCTGGRFYGHYFIQILPPLCLLAAMAIPQTLSKNFKKILACGMIFPALTFWILRIDFEKTDRYFPDDQIFQQKRVGEWLKKNTEENETIFVWGFATAIYFHAERKPASRFLWTDLLTGKIPGSNLSNQKNFDTSVYSNPKAWEKFWEDMQKQPTYFVDTASANIHSYGKYPIQQYGELWNFINQHYLLWNTIEGVRIYKKI